MAWETKAQFDRAIADYDQAISRDPKNAEAFDSLAWLQATCPNPQYRNRRKSLENARCAYELMGNLTGDLRAGILDTLAAAYAENGDFEKSQKCEAKAIDLSADENEKKGYRSRLELYRHGKPYHEALK